MKDLLATRAEARRVAHEAFDRFLDELECILTHGASGANTRRPLDFATKDLVTDTVVAYAAVAMAEKRSDA